MSQKLEISAEDIEQAVIQFYSTGGSDGNLHKLLTRIQVSTDAWVFCWTLLQTHKNVEVQFFGASTLYFKISKSWKEVPDDRVLSLRDQLFETIVNQYAISGPQLVLSKLCVCLSSFILHACPHVWPNWLPELSHILLNQADQLHDKGHIILLEILKFLPEEFVVPASNFSKLEKQVIVSELLKHQSQVFAYLNDCILSSRDASILKSALKCCTSWTQLGAPLSELHNLSDAIFSKLADESLFEFATEALNSILAMPDNHRYTNSLKRLMPHFIKLEPLLSENLSENEDIEKLGDLVRLITNAAVVFIPVVINLVVSSNEQDRTMVVSFVNLVLKCSALPGSFPVQEHCSDLTYTFWYNLQDSIVDCDPDLYQTIQPIFVPVYMTLVETLLVKVKIPDDYQSWGSDEKEAHRCFRTDIADTLMYSYGILNISMLSTLSSLFINAVESQKTWQEIEAVLFALTAIAESVDSEENVYLPQIIAKLQHLPNSHETLLTEALAFLGAYSEWVSEHDDVLSVVLPLLLSALSQPKLTQAATVSLKEMLRENRSHMKPYAPVLLENAKIVLQSGTLKPREKCRLVSCVALALSVLPSEEILFFINNVFIPIFSQLNDLAASEPSPSVHSEIVIRLNMLTWLLADLDINWNSDEDGFCSSPQPGILLVEELLGAFQTLISVWLRDELLIAALCECLCRTLRLLVEDSTKHVSFIQALTQILLNSHLHVQPKLLLLTRQCLTFLYSDQMHHNLAQQLFTLTVVQCLPVVFNGGQEATDVIEEFMNVLFTVCKKHVDLFFSSPVDHLQLFHCGIAALKLPENQTVKAAVCFMTQFLRLSERHDVQQIVSNEGTVLLETVFAGIAGKAPRTVCESLAEVVFYLHKHYFELFVGWLNLIFSQPNFPSATATDEQKRLLIQRLVKKKITLRNMSEMMVQHSLLWRNMYGTEYAEQTSVKLF